MSKACDTINKYPTHHFQIHCELHQRAPSILHSETKYQHNANSKLVFYKTTFNHPHYSTYTHLTLQPTPQVKLMTYADDITITSTYNDINIAKANIQSYLWEMHTCTQINNFILILDAITCTLFKPDNVHYK